MRDLVLKAPYADNLFCRTHRMKLIDSPKATANLDLIIRERLALAFGSSIKQYNRWSISSYMLIRYS